MDTERNDKIEDILGSLDGSRRITAPDFFYTRLRARMEKGLAIGNSRSRIWQPVYIVGILLLLLAINAMVLLRGQNEGNTATAGNNETVQQSIAAEYSLNDNNTMYDLNSDK